MQSPLKEPPLRLPGQSTEKRLYDVLLDKIMLFGVLIAVSVGMIASEWLRFFLNTQPNPTLVTFLLSGLIVFSMLMIIKNYKYVRQLKQGRDGEREVGQILEGLRADGAIIFHDVQNNKGNIDHIVVSPKGIFTVETKTLSKRSGMETIVYNGHAVLVNSRPLDRNPIRQSMAEAQWLKQVLKESTGKVFHITPVIVFPGWFVEPASQQLAKEKHGVWLLNPKALGAFIANCTPCLKAEDVRLVTSLLTQYSTITYANGN